ncbi:MAG: LysM peptidoglycan-binding domain-containing protein [Actinomycetota bacterium]|nr:LysM peptidoglycan-binding domain-containing protein [Actinomycetota bacterium]
MSSIAVLHGFPTTGTSVRRPARRPVSAVSRPVPAGRGPAPVEPAPVQLTRRGRLVLLVVFVAVVFAALTVLGGESAATGESGGPVKTRTVVVSEGDTLWGIASSVAAPGQVREVVYQIEELNALSSTGLIEGQRIAVPRG